MCNQSKLKNKIKKNTPFCVCVLPSWHLCHSQFLWQFKLWGSCQCVWNFKLTFKFHMIIVRVTLNMITLKISTNLWRKTFTHLISEGLKMKERTVSVCYKIIPADSNLTIIYSETVLNFAWAYGTVVFSTNQFDHIRTTVLMSHIHQGLFCWNVSRYCSEYRQCNSMNSSQKMTCPQCCTVQLLHCATLYHLPMRCQCPLFATWHYQLYICFWLCEKMDVWRESENCQLHESHSQCMRAGSPVQHIYCTKLHVSLPNLFYACAKIVEVRHWPGKVRVRVAHWAGIRFWG